MSMLPDSHLTHDIIRTGLMSTERRHRETRRLVEHVHTESAGVNRMWNPHRLNWTFVQRWFHVRFWHQQCSASVSPEVLVVPTASCRWQTHHSWRRSADLIWELLRQRTPGHLQPLGCEIKCSNAFDLFNVLNTHTINIIIIIITVVVVVTVEDKQI